MKPFRYQMDFDCARIVYGRQPASPEWTEPSISAPYSIDIAFTANEHTLVRRASGPAFVRAIPAGTGGLHGEEPVEFLHVPGPSEYLEIQPSLSVRTSVSNEFKSAAALHFDEVQGVKDQVLWAVAARFRAHATGGHPLDPLEADVLVRTLVGHLVCERLDGRRSRVNDRRLTSKTLTRLRDYVDAHLTDEIGVADLARVSHRSTYHFIRSFSLTTGMTPYDYVRAIRMETAKNNLVAGDRVKEAAQKSSYAAGANFRKTFHRHFGVNPSRFIKMVSG